MLDLSVPQNYNHADPLPLLFDLSTPQNYNHADPLRLQLLDLSAPQATVPRTLCLQLLLDLSAPQTYVPADSLSAVAARPVCTADLQSCGLSASAAVLAQANVC